MTMEDNSNITKLIGDVGEIKGILSTIVASHSEAIRKNEQDTIKLRNDLDAVKNELTTAHTNLAILVEANKNKITEVSSDVREVKDKQNSGAQRTTMILSPVIAAGALAWNVIAGSN